MGHGSANVPAHRAQERLQEAKNVREASGDGADAENTGGNEWPDI